MTGTVKVCHAAAAGFEAAREISGLPPGHRARGLHGHSFIATARGKLPSQRVAFPGGEVETLREALKACISRLDYGSLNERVEQPTDENLARWLLSKLALPGIDHVGIQSTLNTGVEIDAQGRLQVWRRYGFQSAHRLPNVPAGHKCGRLHGHGFEVILSAERIEGGAGRIVDHELLDQIWAPLHRQLDHVCLNDLPGLENPTSEVLSSWLWARIKPHVPSLSWVTVFETGSCGASHDGVQYRIWKAFTLDSALKLRRAPGGSALRRIHGHTYDLRLHLCAPLDTVMGWTVDFGDVKSLFDPIFREIDHQPLHEIGDLEDCDSASIAQWILRKARVKLPQLDRVDLFETRGCGAIAWTGMEGLALPV